MTVIQGGIVSQGSIQRELQDGINAIIDSYDAYEKEYEKIFEVFQSQKAYEEDVIRSRTALLQVKPEGQAINYDSYSETGLQRYIHTNYALGVAITQEAIDDNRYLDEMQKAGDLLGSSRMKTKEIVSALMLDNGYTTSGSGLTMWDGQSLFSSSHLTGKGTQTQSNMLSVPSALNQAAIESAIVNISGLYGTDGLLAKIMPRKLVVPRSDIFIAERILKSFLQSDNANNAVNALQSLSALPEGYMVAHYLNNQTNWFIITDQKDGLKFFQRSEYTGTDNDFGTSDYRHKVSTRFSVGCSDWRGVYGSGNAGS